MSLHSRRQHDQAWVIYRNPDLFDPVKRAWAVWVLANSSYACMLNGSYGYDRTDSTAKKMDNKYQICHDMVFFLAYMDCPCPE